MFIIADQRIPEQAKNNLELYGNVLFMRPNEITYSSISAHPDIFFCTINNHLVVAPNLSEDIKNRLKKNMVGYSAGKKPVGEKYPETAWYNSVVTANYAIGNTSFMDQHIKDLAGTREIIHVNQGYTRCNLIPLKNDRFITSDKGIEKVLLKYGLEVLFVDPEGVLLPGFKNGFIGGTCGIWQNNIFFIGSLQHFPKEQKVRDFIGDMEIVELYDGPLFDGGSLIFL
jgi:hypothetical protein